MSKENKITLWDVKDTAIVPANLSQPDEIAEFAQQLTIREKSQIVKAYKDGMYEMATTFIWGRAMASLKRELGSLGITFLGEMLGRTDINEDDNVLDTITEKEAIKLAAELGVVSPTEAMRLRHAQELVSHFGQRDPQDGDEGMEMTDAVSVLLSCVKSILAKPSIQVARRFADFRRDLESKSFKPEDSHCDDLVSSPYFFRRLAIAVLLSGIRAHTGAKLEHCLSNLNLLLPLLWNGLREVERWQVGTTYAQVYADGLQVQMAGIKQALLKVKGFDYVPENLRSQTFIKAAELIIQAHEGLNNFYTEEAPTLNLEKMGTVIPPPALGACITALLCVRLGNRYGVSWSAKPVAERILNRISHDRWVYYFDKILPGEIRILEKLSDKNPINEWLIWINKIGTADLNLSNKSIKELFEASRSKNEGRVESVAEKLFVAYYNKK